MDANLLAFNSDFGYQSMAIYWHNQSCILFEKRRKLSSIQKN